VLALLFYLLSRAFSFLHRDWNLYVSGAGGGVALVLILQLLTA
jgi:hypothetical protein